MTSLFITVIYRSAHVQILVQKDLSIYPIEIIKIRDNVQIPWQNYCSTFQEILSRGQELERLDLFPFPDITLSRHKASKVPPLIKLPYKYRVDSSEPLHAFSQRDLSRKHFKRCVSK
jgi:hypothetical protein